MPVSFLPMDEIAIFDGNFIPIVAQTRRLRPLEIRFWGCDAKGEVIALEQFRRNWVEVSPASLNHPDYVAVVQRVKQLLNRRPRRNYAQDH